MRDRAVRGLVAAHDLSVIVDCLCGSDQVSEKIRDGTVGPQHRIGQAIQPCRRSNRLAGVVQVEWLHGRDTQGGQSDHGLNRVPKERLILVPSAE